MEAIQSTNIFSDVKNTNENTTRFVMSPTNYAYANTIRRLMNTHVPIIAFNADMTGKGTTTDVEIIENSTAMTNEMAAHRVGLIPIHIKDVDSWNPDAYEFECDVIHNGTDYPMDVTTKDINVYKKESDGTRIQLETRDFFKPFNGEEYILLAVLKAQMKGSLGKPEAFRFKARASVGTGKTHARYMPVSWCGYSYTLNTDKEAIDRTFYQWVYEHKKIDEATIKADTEKEAKFRSEFETMEIQRCYKKNESGDPYSFDFVVESVGVLEPNTIVSKAFVGGERLCKSYSSEVLPENVRVEPADSRLTAYDFIFTGEDHTYGHLIQTWIDENLIGKGLVTYVGYDIPHPLKDEMVVRIGVSDYSEQTARKALKDASEACVRMFESWGSQWNTITGKDIISVNKKTFTKKIITRPVA